MPAPDPLPSILRRLDWLEDSAYPFDELKRWPPGALDRLLAAGIIRETNPAREVTCGNCADGCLITPDIVKDQRTGQMVCTGWCHDPEDGGLVTFSIDRLRLWEPHFEGLASHVARALGTPGGVIAVVPGRVCLMASLVSDGCCRDVFMARGLTWPDAAGVVAQADRLKASATPVIVVPTQMPPLDFWQMLRPAVASLTEALVEIDGPPRLDPAMLLARIVQAAPVRHEGEPQVEAPALTRTERDVLEALAAGPHESMLLVELAEAAGYGRHATRVALQRLRVLGLVVKPPGKQRKGDAITATGRALLKQRAGLAARVDYSKRGEIRRFGVNGLQSSRFRR